MRIVVMGGTGQVGRMVVERLERHAQAVVVASPTSGVDARTGRGLDSALEYADAVIDVTNSPDLAGPAARAFFEESTQRLLDAEERAGVKHHVLLSIVGADHAGADGYFAAKRAQERLVQTGPIPHSILRSTQFYDFARVIAGWNTIADTVRLPSKPVQPIAASDVAEVLVEMATGTPLGGAMDVGGPEKLLLPEFVHRVLRTDHDPRYVVEDDEITPVGFNISGDSLLPHAPLRLGPTTLESWVHDEGRRRLVGSR
ncbi:SDR family oxidoreductase [Microbacterium murale]|uniref:NmrA family transcriptional regulator n=1 Tax=Microbacterium murale TaxID=1081040 RepID=A0ABQ1RG29_9MICO|nr:SDR family oxidoreductase [Microbacterium murale]GGD67266.1 NmrA family transcriptional regulator [Microbacterium murale]